MTALIVVLCVLLAVALLVVFLLCPTLPRRSIEKLSGWDYAHRGLWNDENPENSLPAFERACSNGYGIELDVHITTDNVLVVFHDDDLKRMCGVDKRPDECTLAELREMRLLGTDETIPTFDEVLACVNGRSPLIVELKNDKRLMELCQAVYARMKKYNGIWCMESFNPKAVAWFRKNAKEVIRGQLAYGMKPNGKIRKVTLLNVGIASLVGNVIGRPDFIAYEAASDSNLPMWLMRHLRPTLVAWTIRSQKEMDSAKQRYDLIIFEKFIPEGK